MVKQLLLPLAAVAAFIVFVGWFIKKAPELNIPGAIQTATATNKVTIDGVTFAAEIANNNTSRTKGLSGRDSIGLSSGMLFVFDKKDVTPSFWMKDMKFPIDIIWINDGKIVKIDKNAAAPATDTPDSKLTIYPSGQPVDYVFEINAGLSDKNGFKVGDEVILPLE